MMAFCAPVLGQNKNPEPSIIIGLDERVPSKNPRVGRLFIPPDGYATGWLVSNGAVLTAGHCVMPTVPAYLDFNVPLSSDDGTPNPPVNLMRDRYSDIEVVASLYERGAPIRNDWAVLSVGRNVQGGFAAFNQGYYRMTNLDFPKDELLARVTGYGSYSPRPCNGGTGCIPNYSRTEQTAIGKFLGTFPQPAIPPPRVVEIRYLTDTMPGNSGSPVVVNGTTIALGIHNGGAVAYNLGTSFKNQALQSRLHDFPGAIRSPVIPGDRIVYVDAGNASVVADGKIFSPYKSLGKAIESVSEEGDTSLVSIVSGSYPEKSDGLSITLTDDVIISMPVGDVDLFSDSDR